jgi:4-amino-4-deoxy-L-arabinose transferase-like glycosyltransferase
MNFNYLTFSDGAKFALIARNLVSGNGFATDFSFWGTNLFATNGIPALLPYLIIIFFKIFGVNDLAVIAFSFTFYILLVILVFLLASKMFNRIVGLLSAPSSG